MTDLEDLPNSTPASGDSTSADPTATESLNGAADQDELPVKSVYLLPLMMGLFASLAANLFFGWVAWDAHARYQDLVDDMTESDSRQARPSRRLRGKEPSGYRPRERALEEAELLSGGMEPTHG
jgi:hypothetical protein